MRLEECLELGRKCGLEDLDSCLFNVELHAIQIFEYDKIKDELSELYSDIRAKAKQTT